MPRILSGLRNFARTAVPVATLAVLLAGCRLALDVRVDLGGDGSGRLAIALSADAEAQQRAAAAEADPLARLAAAGEDLRGDGWSVSDEASPDGTRTVALSVGFADPEQLTVLSSDLAEALAAPEGRLLEPLRLTVTDDRVRLEGQAALQPAGAGETGRLAEELLAQLEAADFAYTVRVALPDEVVDTTATQVEQRVLTWQVRPGERVDIVAEGVRPRRPWLLPVAGAAALAAVALGVVLLARRAGRGAAPPAGPTGPRTERPG